MKRKQRLCLGAYKVLFYVNEEDIPELAGSDRPMNLKPAMEACDQSMVDMMTGLQAVTASDLGISELYIEVCRVELELLGTCGDGTISCDWCGKCIKTSEIYCDRTDSTICKTCYEADLAKQEKQ